MPELKDYRAQLDKIDEQIVKLFHERLQITGNIGRFKKEHDLPVLDEKREEEKLNAVAALCVEPSEAEGVKELFKTIMKVSRDNQEKIIKR
ncbi:MAG: chorismate mutase [Lachnospiraceae bacterium]|nr:chorismate mutase [Lachnospiraceae bacterium]